MVVLGEWRLSLRPACYCSGCNETHGTVWAILIVLHSMTAGLHLNGRSGKALAEVLSV